MMKAVSWDDVRDKYVARAGGEAAVRQAMTVMLAEVQAQRLGEARKRRHLTQRQVAQAMGVTPSRVGQIERGDIDTSGVEVLGRYVEALGGRLRLVADFDDELVQIA